MAPPASAVIGGQQATPGAWPFAAALIDASVGDTLAGQTCGAVVVSPREVVTAAHCVAGDGSVRPRRRSLDVVAGKLRLRGAGDARVHVTSVRVHPGFDPETLTDDLALLELARPVTGAARLDDGSAASAAQTATALGWGSTTAAPEGDFPDALRQTVIDVEPGTRLRAGLRRRLRSRDDALRGHAAGRPRHVPGRFGRPARGGRRGGSGRHRASRASAGPAARPAPREPTSAPTWPPPGWPRAARRRPSVRRSSRSAGRRRAASARSRSPSTARARSTVADRERDTRMGRPRPPGCLPDPATRGQTPPGRVRPLLARAGARLGSDPIVP